MIDLHCHILPGLDDGPSSVHEAVQMARIAVDDGITTVVASPHMLHPVFTVTAEARDAALSELREVLAQQQIPLTVLPGAECRLHENLIELAKQQPELTINGMGKCLLLECPDAFLPPGFADIVFEALVYDLVPVWVHPERNQAVQANPKMLLEYVEMGIRTAVTAGSLVGEFGFRAKAVAKKLLKMNCVHVLATDGHDPERRPPVLSPGVKAARKIIGAATDALVQDNPAELIGA